MKRIKLQLWDTAGTERFRSVSRSYYRGAAGAILVYDVSSHASFAALPNFLNDARALASPDLTVILAGNKTDVGDEDAHLDTEGGGMSLDNTPPPSSFSSRNSLPSTPSSNRQSMLGAQSTATAHDAFREVAPETASRWASSLPVPIPVAVEVSALSGEGVDELFHRLARIILTKIELGEIDPDDPASGIQYGDSGGYGGGVDDDGSVKSGNFGNEEGVRWRKGRNNRGGGGASRLTGMREWEEVFRLGPRRRGGNCC
ncbi:ras-domain-containing protein [Lophium mytilinum]|uniref:Ras-domain-containing protein n=1 Tax=Lophium mytilinum TaxID=390894 RepID=A0A6A6QQ99_9PEZI|nr:ras-domain-containing protein [Lophium mytilinum]